MSRISSPAPQLFNYKALTAWAILKLRGVQAGKRSTDMIVLPAEFYEMNTPERTRRNWKGGIHKRLEQLEESAVIHAIHILTPNKYSSMPLDHDGRLAVIWPHHVDLTCGDTQRPTTYNPTISSGFF